MLFLNIHQGEIFPECAFCIYLSTPNRDDACGINEEEVLCLMQTRQDPLQHGRS